LHEVEVIHDIPALTPERVEVFFGIMCSAVGTASRSAPLKLKPPG
jgi:hypothetical protein